MENDQISQEINIVRKDEVKRKSPHTYGARNRNTIASSHICSTTDTNISPTRSITCQFKTVSIHNKRRKLNSSQQPSDTSSKITRNEQKGPKFTKDEKEDGNTEINKCGDECGITTGKSHRLTQLLKKDKDGDTVLHLTIVHNDVTKSKSLIEIMKGKSLNVTNKLQQTPLHLSVLTCQPILVQFLIFHGASVNMRDINGLTPLHFAAKNADIDCVKAIKDAAESPKYSPCIVREKLDLNLKNFKGQTAFHLAVLSGSREIAKMLLDMKANINIQDGTCGRTALHLVVESHNINMINFLLENGADVNATTFSGNTALHLASGLHMDQIVQVLIRNGAHVNITNFEGDTPLYVKTERTARWKLPSRPHMKSIHETTKPTCSSRTTKQHTRLGSLYFQ